MNKQILTPEDFTSPDERGGVYLQASALKKYLKHWEEKLQSEGLILSYCNSRMWESL